MPLATLDEFNVAFDYDDTGAPPGSTDYTTFVLVHGVQFNSGIFSRMKPYAAPANTRLVLLNLRDNAQSTPYTAEELSVLTGNNFEAREEFMKAGVRELAAFFAWFIETEKIPPVKVVDGKKTAGLVWAPWSAGNTFGVAFFGFPEVIPERRRKLIEKYLRTYILYDPAYDVVGAPIQPIDILYNLFLDPKTTDEEKAREWVPKLVGDYSSSAAYAAQSLSATKLADLPPLVTFLKKLQTMPDPLTWDVKELDAFDEYATAWRSAMPILRLSSAKLYGPAWLRSLTRGFDGKGNGSEEEKYFPDVKFEMISCMKSLPECVYAAHWAKRIQLEFQENGTKTRDFRMHIIPDVSHGWHWHEPEKALQFLISIS